MTWGCREVVASPGTELVLVRHGLTAWNAEQRIQGHSDVPLCDTGLAQARLLRRALAPELPARLLSSDLARAHATAEVLAAGVASVDVDARLREASFGLFEGRTAAELAEHHSAAYAGWRADSARNRPPGGESVADMARRCVEAIQDWIQRYPGEHVMLVSHGGPIRAIACAVLGLPAEVYPRLRVENTAVARIHFTERGPLLAGWNDTSHLRVAGVQPDHSGWEEK